MCSGCLDTVGPVLRRGGGRLVRWFVLSLPIIVGLAVPASARELRVCADPNNLPFSNERGEGFENKIVEILAKDLGAEVSYVWWAQRRGFVRNTLKAGLCDLIPGTPADLEMLSPTAPYYRSSYVFVTREDGPDISSFDDPRLRDLTIGVQLIGDDGANPPPVTELARRGIVGRLRGFPVYGDYSLPNPPSRIIEAVAEGEIDVAIAWGPLAGYFAERQPVRLKVAPVSPQADQATIPMVYDISMGVRRDDEGLRGEIDAALAKHKPEIKAVLTEYNVPLLDPTGSRSP
mgnify:CR=1 FL=1